MRLVSRPRRPPSPGGTGYVRDQARRPLRAARLRVPSVASREPTMMSTSPTEVATAIGSFSTTAPVTTVTTGVAKKTTAPRDGRPASAAVSASDWADAKCRHGHAATVTLAANAYVSRATSGMQLASGQSRAWQSGRDSWTTDQLKATRLAGTANRPCLPLGGSSAASPSPPHGILPRGVPLQHRAHTRWPVRECGRKPAPMGGG